MSEKKFHSPAGAVTDGAVQADFESAAKYDKAFVGALGVYYRDGFKTKYVPYPALERAFILLPARPRRGREGMGRYHERGRKGHGRRARSHRRALEHNGHRIREIVFPNKNRRFFMERRLFHKTLKDFPSFRDRIDEAERK